MTDIKPRLPIRRFDVFAEYNRLKFLSDGMPEAQAAGRGVWIAKVVAGRRGGGASSGKSHADGKDGKSGAREERKEEKFLSVGGEEQTDRTFEKEIVNRMGREFYQEVFRPAIAEAYKDGKRYEEIRDGIRKGWKV